MTLKPFLVSWYGNKREFQYDGPWWILGGLTTYYNYMFEKVPIFHAAVMAESADNAANIIQNCFPRGGWPEGELKDSNQPGGWRFVLEQKEDWDPTELSAEWAPIGVGVGKWPWPNPVSLDPETPPSSTEDPSQ